MDDLSGARTIGTALRIPTIERIETTAFSVPFSIFLRSGRQMHVKTADHVLVRVIADDGTTGFAEAMSYPEIFGESQTSITRAVADWILPRIKGMALTDLERIWEKLDIIQGNPSAKAAVDIAIHDALARSLHIPLWRMLGGYRDRIQLTWIIGQGTVEEMVREGEDALARGFRAYKIKIGLDPAKDVRAVAALRRALGDDVLLYVDANQAYSYADAVRALPAMEAEGIAIIEDPMSNADIDGRRKLATRLRVPLLGDECVQTPNDLKREIDLGILRMINLKPPRSGYFQSRKIVHLAEQAGFACVMGTFLETDIGVLACAHFTAAHRAFTYPAELTYVFKMKDRILQEPLRVENGTLFLPDRPGMGAEVDEDKLARYRVPV